MFSNTGIKSIFVEFYSGMQIQKNVSLKKLNTFGIDAEAESFVVLNSLEEALEYFQKEHDTSSNFMILGGGSNILFTGDFKGRVIKNNLKGIHRLSEDQDQVYIEAMAGENWHDFVTHCVENNLAGVENLSLIPGNVGASPMQNIGAYGVEVKEVIEEVKAIEISSGKMRVFTADECNFGYRTSLFKSSEKNKYFISSVVFRLNKKPQFNISYGAIASELQKFPDEELSIQKISRAVINIRQSKLPDPKVIGNAGSFFKNPIISRQKYHQLRSDYPDMPVYPVNDNNLKVAAGWLIEKCGWKGKNRGDYGVYDKQSLVLVNYGNASGNEIFQLSEDIIQSVKDKFGIELEREVNIL